MESKIYLKLIDQETYEKLNYHRFVHYEFYHYLYLNQTKIDLKIYSVEHDSIWLSRENHQEFEYKLERGYTRVCVHQSLVLTSEVEVLIEQINQELN